MSVHYIAEGIKGADGRGEELHYAVSKSRERYARFKTNATSDDEGRVSVFALFSRLNHSCNPNCHYGYNDTLRALTVHAVDDIPAWTRLTVSYVEVSCPPKEKRERVLSPWGFSCNCNTCEEDQSIDDEKKLMEEWAGLLETRRKLDNGTLRGRAKILNKIRRWKLHSTW